MSDLDIADVLKHTRIVVAKAIDDGSVGDLTPRVVRQEVEKLMGLEGGTLDEKEYKRAVKATRTPPCAPKAKAKATSKTEKKSASRKETKSTKTPSVRFLSVASRLPGYSDLSRHPLNLTMWTRIPQPPKKRLKQESQAAKPDSTKAPKSKSHSMLVSQPKDAVEHSSSSVTLVNSSSTEDVPESKAEDGNKSESEMSVLIDAPPKKTKRKDKQRPPKTKKEPTEKKGKPPAKELSKDEETIKRLKSFVVACGVRKVWAKEFKDLASPAEQIRRLKAILGDLGMSGRMSLEQAKAIRAKRELAQELEDVQKFEKNIVSGPEPSTRTRRKGATARVQEASDEEEEEDDSDEEAAAAPKRRRATAHQSIMAFLGDQSDDE
ncbi:hypothetical protein B0H21DRAFT_719639 [Amylocystis lapponica]|nr:hypothetical protein B0H21DRAFT_719639 [Amylocystis lapponica]